MLLYGVRARDTAAAAAWRSDVVVGGQTQQVRGACGRRTRQHIARAQHSYAAETELARQSATISRCAERYLPAFGVAFVRRHRENRTVRPPTGYAGGGCCQPSCGGGDAGGYFYNIIIVVVSYLQRTFIIIIILPRPWTGAPGIPPCSVLPAYNTIPNPRAAQQSRPTVYYYYYYYNTDAQ